MYTGLQLVFSCLNRMISIAKKLPNKATGGMRQSKQAAGVVFCGGLLLVGIWGPFSIAADQVDQQDVVVITELASELMPLEADLMVHQGAVWHAYQDEDEFSILIEQLIESISGVGQEEDEYENVTEKDYSLTTIHGRPAAEWKFQTNQAMQTVRMVGMNDGATYVTVRWEGSLKAADDAIRWQEKIAPVLEEMELYGAWRAQVQGWIGSAVEPDDVLNTTALKFQATKLDSYEDAGSRSVSFASKLLNGSVELPGGQEMNLQAALHRDTETAQWRITLASPVILAEY